MTRKTSFGAYIHPVDSRKRGASSSYSAGVIVVHVSPFDALETPTNTGPSSELVRSWTDPYYMELSFPWEAKFGREDGKRVELPSIQERLVCDYASITPDVVAQMLAQRDWRPRRTAAIFAALKHMVEFEEQIGRLLLKSEVCAAAVGYCVALAAFQTETGLQFLKRYLDYYLGEPRLWFDQRSVMGTLLYFDDIFSTTHAEEYSEPWRHFLMSQIREHYTETSELMSLWMDWLKDVRRLAGDA